MTSFYKGKKVLVTGHTGFKGSWLSMILIEAGADVVGYSLKPSEKINLFDLSGNKEKMISIIGDVRDLENLKKVFYEHKPEIVIHLAAQPIVRESYQNPVYTYETNVLGTVNIMECIRVCGGVKSFLNVTTDKVYDNKEWAWGYRENDNLNGFDPYSNSKSCSELVTSSYKKSFFELTDVRISTARAGNVIGGGDFSKDRIIPDCVRSAINKEQIFVRNPKSVRPYQHVLEPLFAYLKIVEKQYEDKNYQGSYNVGPDDQDCVSTGILVDLFCKSWGRGCGWSDRSEKGSPHEANFLKLDCSKMKSKFNWKPQWHIDTAVKKTVEWYEAWDKKENIREVMSEQIKEYEKGGY